MELSHSDWAQAKELLVTGQYTCVLKKGDTVHTTIERGVKPLVRWLTEGIDLRGFWAADKVVGKATAYLYCLLGVQAVHAHVMSESAARVLEKNGIEAAWDTLVPNIINRGGDGICPFEAAVLEIDTPDGALTVIRAKMQEMNIVL